MKLSFVRPAAPHVLLAVAELQSLDGRLVFSDSGSFNVRSEPEMLERFLDDHADCNATIRRMPAIKRAFDERVAGARPCTWGVSFE